MERYIFLDVDGVLNSDSTTEYTPNGFVGVSNENIEVLKKILNVSGAKIILTSTWRLDWERNYENCATDGKYLVDRLKEFGIEITDKIPGEERLAYRGEEIDTYVKQHNLKNWIVIDDEYFFDFNMYQIYSEGENPRLLMTDYRYGLQPSDIVKVKSLFNLQEN